MEKLGFMRIHSGYIWGLRNQSDSFGMNFLPISESCGLIRTEIIQKRRGVSRVHSERISFKSSESRGLIRTEIIH